MAHGDYHCCAICDCKLHYGGYDTRTKENVCMGCMANLAKADIIIYTVDDLIEWIKASETEDD
jgi:hypothetical protein